MTVVFVRKSLEVHLLFIAFSVYTHWASFIVGCVGICVDLREGIMLQKDL